MKPAGGRALWEETAEGPTMKQPHTEQTIDHTDGQQNTGNHHKSGAAPGGTRQGAENVEPMTRDKAESVEKATDVDKMPSLDGTDPGTKTDTSRERAPERDEHGRM
jgi:hypothetical protein